MAAGAAIDLNMPAESISQSIELYLYNTFCTSLCYSKCFVTDKPKKLSVETNAPNKIYKESSRNRIKPINLPRIKYNKRTRKNSYKIY